MHVLHTQGLAPFDEEKDWIQVENLKMRNVVIHSLSWR